MRDRRTIADEKSPKKSPLIVESENYQKVVHSGEYPLVIISAPYGSGKTVGVGLKLYHDVKFKKAPRHVIMVKLRTIPKDKAQSSFVNLLVRNPLKLMYTGIFLPMLELGMSDECRFVEMARYCYSTLDNRDVESIRNILGDSLDSVISDSRPSKVAESLLNLQKNWLRGKPLFIVIDEFEGFYEQYPRNFADFIKSYMTATRYLYDSGVKQIKLVLLIQKMYFTQHWRDIQKHLISPMPQQVLHQGEWLPQTAAQGTTLIHEAVYYPGEIYFDYILKGFEAAKNDPSFGESNQELNHEISRIHYILNKKILSSKLKASLLRHLDFLQAIAPRMAFSLMDHIAGKIAEKIQSVEIGSADNNINEVVKEIVTTVADTFTQQSTLFKVFYNIHLHEGLRSISEYRDGLGRFFDALAADVLKHGARPVSFIETYYSYIGYATMSFDLDKTTLLLIVLKLSRGGIIDIAKESAKVNHLLDKIGKRLEEFLRLQQLPYPKPFKTLNIKTLTIFHEGDPNYNLISPCILNEVRKLGERLKSGFGFTKLESQELGSHRISSERFAIILVHGMMQDKTISLNNEETIFLQEKYREIVEEMRSFQDGQLG